MVLVAYESVSNLWCGEFIVNSSQCCIAGTEKEKIQVFPD